MKFQEQRRRFRELLAGGRCHFAGPMHDPVSAMAASQLGFECGMLPGSIASLSVLGAPDVTVITLPELAEQARRICRATGIPLIVDADHGYGNALNVQRTVQELENAGVSAITIEDTALPRPYGQTAKTTLIPLAEGVGKMRAALAARRDPGLVIVGRTSAVAATDVADALERVLAYEAAGVDMVFLAGLKRWADLEAIAGKVSVPIMLGSVPPDFGDAERLGAAGVRVSLIGHKPYMASVKALIDTLRLLREDPRAAASVIAPAEFEQIIGKRAYAEAAASFLQ
ncbi:isocitrate lyase/PEP mutase family protein [Pigmentiphaga soli]|uniref:Isocitrate lyase/PEP mutase family protein n=1 Tax=Pigmentiphaga soli TaxID=1007095 RepID=A0ABP8GLJ1_9BURK